MSTDFNSQIDTTLTSEQKLTLASGKVAHFAYDDTAYTNDTVAGTDVYDYNSHQNIPLGSPSVLNTDGAVLDKGVRSQASSITRMMLNHFFGRASYNINKLSDHLKTLLTIMKTFMVEGDNAYSATAEYTIGCVVYVMSTENSKVYKRTFVCIQACTDTPPLDSNGLPINTSYWKEIGGNMSHLDVRGGAHFENDVIADKDLTVKGDLVVEGSTIVTDEQTVSTKSDYVVLRESNASGLGANEKSGMVIHNYDSNKNAFLGVGNDGTFRVSDNASETVTSYTNISKYGSTFYTGISQTPAVVVNGAIVSQDVDELEDCVNEQSIYYHYFNGKWYAVSLVNNALYFDETDPITDTSLINTLDALTKDSLFYYRAVSILVVSDSANQPLLTRQESSSMANDDILRWDATNKRAKGGLKVNDITSLASTYILTNSRTITGGVLSAGSSINVLFQADITGSSIDTNLTLNYNGTDYDVKVMKAGQLVDFEAVLYNNAYSFIQADTPISFIFDGTYFQVIGNPVVLNINDYDICANGEVLKSKRTITQTGDIDVFGDTIAIINAQNVTWTLNFDSYEGAVVDVFALEDCTITYYTSIGNTASLSMKAGTKAEFMFFNGWQYSGIYSAIWN